MINNLKQKRRDNRETAWTNWTNPLYGKAVLLIGCDTAVLQNLVEQLARRGANIVLLCWRMPLDIIPNLQTCVQTFGRQLILIERAENQRFTVEQLIHKVITDWGQIDIFIDISASKVPVDQQDELVEKEIPAADLPQKWQITRAVLEEVAHA